MPYAISLIATAFSFFLLPPSANRLADGTLVYYKDNRRDQYWPGRIVGYEPATNSRKKGERYIVLDIISASENNKVMKTRKDMQYHKKRKEIFCYRDEGIATCAVSAGTDKCELAHVLLLRCNSTARRCRDQGPEGTRAKRRRSSRIDSASSKRHRPPNLHRIRGSQLCTTNSSHSTSTSTRHC